MRKKYFLLVSIIFVIVLSGSRFLWMNTFHNPSDISIENGELYLLNWHGKADEILLLDGEWEFYPSQWLIDHEEEISTSEQTSELIQVPGRWNEKLNSEKPSPYGYGSYRLRIYVDPEEEDETNYSVHVPSVRSSSEVYVNGRLLAGSGEVGETREDYHAKNLPYLTTFSPDENGLIELVIQAANFKDIRQSGIIRSIKFGSEEAVSKDRTFSIAMQVVAIAIFLMHSIYSLILFFLGNRDKRLVYFSVLVFCLAIMNLFSSDEKLFHLLFYIGYDWDFRIANATIPIACLALLQCTNHFRVPYWNKINPFFSIISIGVSVLTLFLAPSQVIAMFPVYYLLAGIAILVSIIAIVKTIYKDVTENTLLFFSFIAALHHFAWLIYWREIGISVTYYPFDLIIAIGLFASIWFRNYFLTHSKTEKLAAQLQKMNEQKDQFLANTSHEFKNPLHGMINMSQSVLLREKQVLKDQSIYELETILTVGRRMSLLLNDLLDVAHLKEGRPLLQKKNIVLQPVVTGVIDLLQFTVEVKPVKIINQIPEDFPPVSADENRIVQVIFNLLHNAIKFTDEGTISIRAAIKDDKALISIVDTGKGMDKKFLQRLFQPYEQVTDESMIEGGFGLGLSISKQLVELHGGEMEVTSTPGDGSTFTFTLPLATFDKDSEEKMVNPVQDSTNYLLEPSSDLTEIEIANRLDLSQLQQTPKNQLAILIVDDDPINLQVMQSILSAEQYEITTAINGKEALKKLGKKEWNLVISDVMLPQMSGYELTKKIRERYTITELPILLLTARSDPRDVQAGFLAGANDYVTKPVEMLELRSRVNTLAMMKISVREQLQLESAWLQSQIQPHFLFNTLNSIIALSAIDLNKMNDLLHELSEFLRSKLRLQNIDELIPIEDELNIIRSYLNIEKVRFGDRLQVEWQIDIDEDIKIPFLTIQPLVENAIRHGIMKRIKGGKVIIKISVYDDYAEITVEDNGVGMSDDQLKNLLKRKNNSRTGIGLINTNQRLIRHFGRGLQIKSAIDQGTSISFIVKF